MNRAREIFGLCEFFGELGGGEGYLLGPPPKLLLGGGGLLSTFTCMRVDPH